MYINVEIHARDAQTIMSINVDANRVCTGFLHWRIPQPVSYESYFASSTYKHPPKMEGCHIRAAVDLSCRLSTLGSFPITCSSDNLTRSEYLPFNNQFTCYLSNYTVKQPLCFYCFLSLNICNSVSSICLQFQIITYLKPIFPVTLSLSLADNYNI